MGTGRSEWGIPLPVIATHLPSSPLSLHATVSKSAVCGSLSLRLLRTTSVVSSQSLPNNQRNSTSNLKQCRFFTGLHISSPTGNFPLSQFVQSSFRHAAALKPSFLGCPSTHKILTLLVEAVELFHPQKSRLCLQVGKKKKKARQRLTFPNHTAPSKYFIHQRVLHL